MSAKNIVGKNIRKLRKTRKLTQTQLSKLTGYSQNTISSHESGTRGIDELDIQRYSEALKVSPEDLFNRDEKVKSFPTSSHKYFDIGLSAGLPNHVDAITDADTIEIPDSIMGKYAGQSDIFITKVNGQSMNKVIPDQSLIAVKPIDIHQIKNGDIVVYSDNGDYSVKRFYKNDTQLIFRPESHDSNFFDYITSVDNENLIIHGKVVVYIVTLD